MGKGKQERLGKEKAEKEGGRGNVTAYLHTQEEPY